MTRSEEVEAIDAWLATYKSSQYYIPRYESRHTITKVENNLSDVELFDWVIDPACESALERCFPQGKHAAFLMKRLQRKCSSV